MVSKTDPCFHGADLLVGKKEKENVQGAMRKYYRSELKPSGWVGRNQRRHILPAKTSHKGCQASKSWNCGTHEAGEKEGSGVWGSR